MLETSLPKIRMLGSYKQYLANVEIDEENSSRDSTHLPPIPRHGFLIARDDPK